MSHTGSVKAGLKTRLMDEYSRHAIVRLPNGVFAVAGLIRHFGQVAVGT